MQTEKLLERRLVRVGLTIALWTLFGLFLGSQMYLAYRRSDMPIGWHRIIALEMAYAYVWAALTPLAGEAAGTATVRTGPKAWPRSAWVAAAALLLAAAVDGHHPAERGAASPDGGAIDSTGDATMMGFYAIQLDVLLAVWGIILLLLDAFVEFADRKMIGYMVAMFVALIFLYSFFLQPVDESRTPIAEQMFHGMYRLDAFALYFKRLFLGALTIVLIMSAEYSDRLETGVAEFYALLLLCASGMMMLASVNDFILLFVALELVTITFYVLTSFQRGRLVSLEADKLVELEKMLTKEQLAQLREGRLSVTGTPKITYQAQDDFAVNEVKMHVEVVHQSVDGAAPATARDPDRTNPPSR
jgi:hypothetical protein